MEKFSSKAAANPLPATNAAAGSPERDAQSPPAQSETHPPESAAAPSSNSEVFDLPPSEFGDDLTTRYFVTRMDRLDDGAWHLNVVTEVAVQELARGCGFDPDEFSALTSEQRQRAAGLLLDGYGPDAAIEAAGNPPTFLKLVDIGNA